MVDSLGVDVCVVLKEEGGHLQAAGVAGPEEGGPLAPIPRVHLMQYNSGINIQFACKNVP
jgi:hypothetical protein